MCNKNPDQRLHASEIAAKLVEIGESEEFDKDRIRELENEVERLKWLLRKNNIAY